LLNQIAIKSQNLNDKINSNYRIIDNTAILIEKSLKLIGITSESISICIDNLYEEVSIKFGNNLKTMNVERADITKNCSRISSFSTDIPDPKDEQIINSSSKRKRSNLIINSDDEDENKEKIKKPEEKIHEKKDFSILVQCDQIKIDYAAPNKLLSTYDGH
jgi:hypothetical protein